jgi:hypothetical protein
MPARLNSSPTFVLMNASTEPASTGAPPPWR